MRTYSSRAPIVGTVATLVGRWTSQDVARGNAAAAATRLRRQRRELADVDAFLAARQREREVGIRAPERRTPSAAP